MYWVIPEIIHTIPTDGKLEIQVGEGGGGGGVTGKKILLGSFLIDV